MLFQIFNTLLKKIELLHFYKDLFCMILFLNQWNQFIIIIVIIIINEVFKQKYELKLFY